MIQFKILRKKEYLEEYYVSGNAAYTGSNMKESFVLPDHLVPALKVHMLPHIDTFNWGVKGTYGGERAIPTYKSHPFVTFIEKKNLPDWVRRIVESDEEEVPRCPEGRILFEMVKL